MYCFILYWENAFFVYGFPKNERDNISQEEERVFKDLAQQLFAFSEDVIEEMVQARVLMEVPYNDK